MNVTISSPPSAAVSVFFFFQTNLLLHFWFFSLSDAISCDLCQSGSTCLMWPTVRKLSISFRFGRVHGNAHGHAMTHSAPSADIAVVISQWCVGRKLRGNSLSALHAWLAPGLSLIRLLTPLTLEQLICKMVGAISERRHVIFKCVCVCVRYPGEGGRNSPNGFLRNVHGN